MGIGRLTIRGPEIGGQTQLARRSHNIWMDVGQTIGKTERHRLMRIEMRHRHDSSQEFQSPIIVSDYDNSIRGSCVQAHSTTTNVTDMGNSDDFRGNTSRLCMEIARAFQRRN